LISLITEETNMSKSMPDVFMDERHLAAEMHNLSPYLVLKHVKINNGERLR